MDVIDRKIERLSLFFLAAFAVAAGFLFYWQVVDANTLVNRPDNKRLGIAQLAVHRGTIYDRNGVALAQTSFGAGGNPVRTYAIPSLSPLLGYHSVQLGYGNTGLEDVYNDYLNGQGTLQPVDNTVRRLLHEPIIGDNLRLTIDARIQRIASDAMGHGAGACVVMDTRSGEVLAMESQPWVDSNRIDEQGYVKTLQARTDSPFLDRAIRATYAPGSTFKTVTLTAAYDTGKYDTTTVLSGTDAVGPLYEDGVLLPSSINNLPPNLYSINTIDAFKYSDNIAFAAMGVALGPHVLLDYAGRFGFGGPIPFELPVKASSVSPHPDTLSRLDVAYSAFGQDAVLATPLQMLLTAAAVAGGGAEPRPYVVAKVTAPNGEALQQNGPSALARPMSAGTAAKMAQAMTAVVEAPGGSGFLARVQGVTVAGKTGTAQVTSGAPHAWFVAYAPAEKPRLAVVVFKQNGGEGYSQAAPIAGAILRQALPLVR